MTVKGTLMQSSLLSTAAQVRQELSIVLRQTHYEITIKTLNGHPDTLVIFHGTHTMNGHLETYSCSRLLGENIEISRPLFPRIKEKYGLWTNI
jgi:hypothetical protein